MLEEIFGPVLPIITYRNATEAIAFVKPFEKPLSFYLFTKNQTSINAWVKNLSFGGGCINNTSWHFTNAELPFGGVGNSGIGAYHGKHSFKTFSHYKPILDTPTWFDPSIKYPPMKGKLKWLKRFIK
jgi:aldehyde dehydrogenase (NAD+)